jgi:hypothetical protein
LSVCAGNQSFWAAIESIRQIFNITYRKPLGALKDKGEFHFFKEISCLLNYFREGGKEEVERRKKPSKENPKISQMVG